MKKILMLLPDGVGVRNFLFGDFLSECKKQSLEITWWLPKSLYQNLHLKDNKILLPHGKVLSFFVNILRMGWQKNLLLNQANDFKNPIFLSYIFKTRKNITFRGAAQQLVLELLILYAKYSKKRTKHIKFFYKSLVRKSKYYRGCERILSSNEIDLVFCTHQRASSAIAPMLAAQSLGIRTACFIFSWDNLPKGSLLVEADYYFVWSRHMYNELISYYPDIRSNQIKVVGTPQFVPYFDESIYVSREVFATQHNIPLDAFWICFSGDDITTSPNDPNYLEDMAKAVRVWNESQPDRRLHIIFRRCPVDFSNRYASVLTNYADIITPIIPAWYAPGDESGWNTVLPSPEDIPLLVNTVRHCEFVVNVGSTMAHDFAIFEKPCIYINYNIDNSSNWDINTIYDYIHFQTMKNLNPVIWINDVVEWTNVLDKALINGKAFVEDCKRWTERIALHPLEDATNRFVETIKNLG